MGAVHYVYLAIARGRVAYVGMGKRRGRYDRIDRHLRGYSSADKRGLKAELFIVAAYTRNRRLAEKWERWLHAVFNPPYAERRPRRPPRKPPLFPRARRRDKPVEEPMIMAKYAELMGFSPAPLRFWQRLSAAARKTAQFRKRMWTSLALIEEAKLVRKRSLIQR
ncbi:hypothetical protein ODS41_09525 [Pyrobaculum sp. 3827-6]|uniref:hypothetical protein n=1 Tax=Pyrobaculum sp. 3827-6 TaxID=2983604 RepID=UPI0021DA655D|nr:hypothetical protein [Pyrobaculum sp. 3827-6]MCU7788148.1 hypothetical protein [Pyrobaculum sp. 3827-6]